MRKILVIADQKGHEQIAVPQALRLAEAFSVAVHVVFFCHESLRDFGDEAGNIKRTILSHIHEYADQCMSDHTASGLEVDYEVVWKKYIHYWVNDYAKNHSLLMVVKTAHHSETFNYTPTDWHLFRECPAPVLIVSESSWRKAGTIMAAVDLESKHKEKRKLNARVLKYAKDLAGHLNYELHLCYVSHLPGLLCDIGLKFPEEETLKAKKRLKRRVIKLSDDLGIPAENIHIRAGEPGKVIPSITNKNKSAMLVMGTTGRKGIKGRLMGNTAEKVLSLLRTDVLAIKP